jgi:inosose dehydratase
MRTVDQRVQRTRMVIELAHQVGVPVVVSAAGSLTHPETGEPSAVAIEALGQIGEFADASGVQFAIRPAYEGGARLSAVLRAVGCPAVRVCLDPAAMVMVGTDPLASIDQYVESVALLHVRDATAGFADRRRGEGRAGRETPLGEGDADIAGILEVLRDAEYRSPYILRRTDAPRPIDDLQMAREVLARMCP